MVGKDTLYLDIFLAITLVFLIAISAFFSGSETSMTSLNRYRLRYLARKKHKKAQCAQSLLEKPDRLLGMILVGNTFANILASAIATYLATEWFGQWGLLIIPVLLTIVILIFAEITPKTIAVKFPEAFAFKVVGALKFLMKIAYPLVWVINGLVMWLLKPFGFELHSNKNETISNEELRAVVTSDSTTRKGLLRQNMLLGVLDLEKTTIEDVMVIRNNILAIDIEDDWKKIQQTIKKCPYSRIPVYEGDPDKMIGVFALRNMLLLSDGDPKGMKNHFRSLLDPCYFVPEHTPLEKQLINFQKKGEHLAIVVDEYGDIQGIVTVEDILEEIVGEFSHSDQPSLHDSTTKLPDGSYIVHGSMTIRDINRQLDLSIPNNGPKTLSGLITEQLQSIPNAKTTIIIAGHPIEIIQVEDNAVELAKIQPIIKNSL